MNELKTFIHSEIEVKIRKGELFSNKDLKFRLSKMDINLDERKKVNRPFLVNLYDKALEDNENKIKIFDLLKEDTVGENKY